MSQANKIKQIQALRQNCVDRLSDLKIIADAALQNENFHVQFKARIPSLERIKHDFDEQHAALLTIVSTVDAHDLAGESVICKGFDDTYYAIKAIEFQLFDNQQNVSSSGKSSNVRLPKIDLFKFDGNPKDWNTFFDMFNSLVHENNELSNVEKFNYLLASLNGPPLTIVKCNRLTDANYIIAYNALKARYDNKRALATAHYRELENAPKLTDNTATPQNLRQLVDTFEENLAALKNLEFETDKWDFLIFNMLLRKLDSNTVSRFEIEFGSNEIPVYSDLKEFVLKQCDALDRSVNSSSKNSHKFEISKSKNVSRDSRQNPPSYQRPSSSFMVHTKPAPICFYCKQDHSIYKCPKFSSHSPQERYNIAKNNKWCINCLGNKHQYKDCSSSVRCSLCKMKHNSLLHFTYPPNDQNVASSDSSPNNNPSSHHSVTSLTNLVPSSNLVLLSTALIEVRDPQGNFHVARILLDSGSQANFVSERFCNKLGLSRHNITLSIQGLTHMNSTASKAVSLTLRPRLTPDPLITIEAVVLPRICDDMPRFPLSRDAWSHISTLKLADPDFHVPKAIDMLLGVDIFSQILQPGKLSGKNNEPTAVNTTFGWILMGTVSCNSSSAVSNSFFCSCDLSIEKTLKRFWELEEVPRKISISPEDELCEKLFLDNVRRDTTGRFTVSLPFRIKQPTFPHSRSIAERRFISLERRLLVNPLLHKQYCEFMRDYLDSGHMSPLKSQIVSDRSYYIPHHCVVNPNSSTTKLRVVFDASCKSSNGMSLNDTLLIGSKLQRDLPTILLNFRLRPVALIGDIRQMFRQINLTEADRVYQKILWRFTQEDPIQEYVLNTVTYGLSSSPFLAIRTILYLAEIQADFFPLASKCLKSSMYVDDVVTSCDSLEAAHALKTELISLLQSGGFELHKWGSNIHSLVVTNSISKSVSLDLDNPTTVKVLGLQWNSSLDTFSFQVNPNNSYCTKRTILSELARVFDPLGFLSPLTLYAKILIQDLWSHGLNWDDTPPPDILHSWKIYQSDLQRISEISIPRHILSTPYESIELHGYADASKKGYAGVVYLRVIHSDEDISTFFVCSKSKVAPVKVVSIPRLELCAAVLLSSLLSSVVESFKENLQFHRIFAWTDSTVTLHWIGSSPHKHKTFISNRISSIHDKFPPSIWHYVPSEENPADCASRGMTASQFLENPSWWAGPPWLKSAECNWPIPPEVLVLDKSILEEEKRFVFTTLTSSPNFLDTLINDTSSLLKIQRIVAYIRRFIKNIRNPTEKIISPLCDIELHSALLVLIKQVQSQTFAEEFSLIQAKKPIPKVLRKLSPFIDETGLLRVGGRLTYSTLSYDKKFPILLPNSHRLTFLMIEFTHKQFLHPGVQTMQFLLSQRYWILSPKKTIRRVLSNCHRCWKLNPTPLQPPMGNLPSLRISQIKPFSAVGVDFCGPFLITQGKYKNARQYKTYICVFVCFATKALHFEVVRDLSSDAFLAALRRFISRRGRCSYIFSDCGTNFVGASNQIKLMAEAASCENLTWHFNPPSSPHFGGLWEAGVKSLKTHIFRVIGEQVLTYDELETLVVQIEAVLNSRPLCPISADPNDLSVLTPGHFLTLEPLNALVDADLKHIQLNRLGRWQLVQRLHQDFWARWSKEYLHTLHQRSKWTKNASTLEPGTLVLIKNDNSPPLQWLLGRVTETHPGLDGVVRVATVKTKQGVFKRPLVKLCVLPVDSSPLV